jgi:hypothetical protein
LLETSVNVLLFSTLEDLRRSVNPCDGLTDADLALVLAVIPGAPAFTDSVFVLSSSGQMGWCYAVSLREEAGA